MYLRRLGRSSDPTPIHLPKIAPFDQENAITIFRSSLVGPLLRIVSSRFWRIWRFLWTLPRRSACKRFPRPSRQILSPKLPTFSNRLLRNIRGCPLRWYSIRSPNVLQEAPTCRQRKCCEVSGCQGTIGCLCFRGGRLSMVSWVFAGSWVCWDWGGGNWLHA